jgi:hypothetical protein
LVAGFVGAGAADATGTTGAETVPAATVGAVGVATAGRVVVASGARAVGIVGRAVAVGDTDGGDDGAADGTTTDEGAADTTIEGEGGDSAGATVELAADEAERGLVEAGSLVTRATTSAPPTSATTAKPAIAIPRVRVGFSG